MARESKKTKTETSPKADTATKKDTASKVEDAAAKDAPKSSTKGGSQRCTQVRRSRTGYRCTFQYCRGEGQKPVTAAYKENWNAIFGKKKRRR